MFGWKNISAEGILKSLERRMLCDSPINVETISSDEFSCSNVLKLEALTLVLSFAGIIKVFNVRDKAIGNLHPREGSFSLATGFW
jgi:hypothetical protein